MQRIRMPKCVHGLCAVHATLTFYVIESVITVVHAWYVISAVVWYGGRRRYAIPLWRFTRVYTDGQTTQEKENKTAAERQ